MIMAAVVGLYAAEIELHCETQAGTQPCEGSGRRHHVDGQPGCWDVCCYLRRMPLKHCVYSPVTLQAGRQAGRGRWPSSSQQPTNKSRVQRHQPKAEEQASTVASSISHVQIS